MHESRITKDVKTQEVGITWNNEIPEQADEAVYVKEMMRDNSKCNRRISSIHHRPRMVVHRCTASWPLAISDIHRACGVACDVWKPSTAGTTTSSPPAVVGLLVITLQVRHQSEGCVGQYLCVPSSLAMWPMRGGDDWDGFWLSSDQSSAAPISS